MRASKKVKGAVLLSAGAALVLGAPTVHAESGADDNNGLVSGLNLLNDVQLNVPVTVGGAGVLGVGEGSSTVKTTNEGSDDDGGGSSSSSSDGNSGLVSGANVGNNLQANVPVTVCGVGALLARGEGDCEVAASNTKGSGGSGSSSADDNNGLVAGANALNNAQLNVPVTVCGLAVLGDAECESEVAAANSGGGDNDDDLLGAGDGDSSSSSDDNSGLVAGLNLLNDLDANVPVTVCGLAVLGDADGSCEVEATNGDDDGDVAGVDRDRNSAVRGATLPHTGAAGLALIPFGLALVAGGVALRRRVGSES